MKGEANISPIAALSFPNSKRYPFTAGLTEFISRRMVKPSLELTPSFGDILCDNQATLTTYDHATVWLLYANS